MSLHMFLDLLGFCLMVAGSLMFSDAVASRAQRDRLLTVLHGFVAILLGIVGFSAAAV